MKRQNIDPSELKKLCSVFNNSISINNLISSIKTMDLFKPEHKEKLIADIHAYANISDDE